MSVDTTLPAWGFRHDTQPGRWLARLTQAMEWLAAAVLAADVLVVFLSVVYRYFLHDPVDWAEEAARALMIVLVFFGAATVLARSQHVGVDFFRQMLPASWHPAMVQVGHWMIAFVSASLLVSSVLLLADSYSQTTPLGLPQWLYVYPVVAGSLFMTLFAVANAVNAPARLVWLTLVASALLLGAVYAWNALAPSHAIPRGLLLAAGFFTGLVAGVPIGFVLAFSSLLYFLSDPSLPILVYSQQVMAGSDHFVLLAIPFFVLAGLLMESNGMSSRLIELLLRVFGRVRGGLGLITITATAFFSGVSGSKLADVAAVGGIVMPAVRRTRQDPNEAAGLLASTAVMAETIPPCINMIIMGFVANISIAGLFMAGLLPAVVMAVALATLAVIVGRKIDPDEAFPQRRPLLRLLGGALVAILMVAMIGKGVVSGIATSTEVSAFAVVYALVAGGLAFRELSLKSIAQLFVKSASMAGSILFIVAAASSLSFALTIEQVPQAMSATMVAFAQHWGSTMFLLLAVLLMVVFGAVLEGAPALIIFGPLLTPIAAQLGVHPLHFGTVMVIAMGLGLFAPPVGLGLFATCALTGTQVKDVARPMLKYLLVLALTLVLLALVPSFSLWLPNRLGL
ncbi:MULTISPECIES: TRAP transporter large permease subunit [Ramlibacter]|uniref:TRAP transporter large permease subunit n=1 Tax=Ramlibacter pinisoli TaxID=2682844 RepID=A0A6N8IZL5_9BURK|nr:MULTISPECIES: TRAP transporter large permease subunit [Ramlibacter]MBA2962059.1 TRAP transporter large permease subunit [Ramlibacter sp. CGMCC 1.13660]MVQ32002.1 TRAP transporter large permease subunit [Ramlibacter pinisoli]